MEMNFGSFDRKRRGILSLKNNPCNVPMMCVPPAKIKMEPQNCWFGSMFFFFFKEVFSSFKMLVFQSVPRFDVEFSEHGSFVEMRDGEHWGGGDF